MKITVSLKVTGKLLQLAVQEALSKRLAQLLGIWFGDLGPELTTGGLTSELNVLPARPQTKPSLSPQASKMIKGLKIDEASKEPGTLSPSSSKHTELTCGKIALLVPQQLLHARAQPQSAASKVFKGHRSTMLKTCMKNQH